MVSNYILVLLLSILVLTSCVSKKKLIIDVEDSIEEIKTKSVIQQEDVNVLCSSLYLDYSLKDRFMMIDSTSTMKYIKLYNLTEDNCSTRNFDVKIFTLDRPFQSIEDLIVDTKNNFYLSYLTKEGIPPFSKKHNDNFMIYKNKVYVEYDGKQIGFSAELFELVDSTTVKQKFLYLLLD